MDGAALQKIFLIILRTLFILFELGSGGALTMGKKLMAIWLGLLITAVGCGRAHSTTQVHDACSLLTTEDIHAVQGEAVQTTKGGSRADGGLSTSQCFFQLPTFNRSVSLEVTQDVSSSGKTEELWERRFGEGAERSEAEEERTERQRELGEKGETDEKSIDVGPQAIDGVGDEAFWSGTQINGSLYVRKGPSIIRLSVGGPADQTAKIETAKRLAEKVIARLY